MPKELHTCAECGAVGEMQMKMGRYYCPEHIAGEKEPVDLDNWIGILQQGISPVDGSPLRPGWMRSTASRYFDAR